MSEANPVRTGAGIDSAAPADKTSVMMENPDPRLRLHIDDLVAIEIFEPYRDHSLCVFGLL